MIEPYTAVGLIRSLWGIRRREDIEKNLEHLESLTKAAFWLSNLDIPVRLVAIPEGALQGFNDEVLDVDHAEFARTCAIDIPGPETDRLGQLARKWGVFIMAQAKARHEDWLQEKICQQGRDHSLSARGNFSLELGWSSRRLARSHDRPTVQRCSWEGNGVPDDDSVVADQDLLGALAIQMMSSAYPLERDVHKPPRHPRLSKCRRI